METIVVSFNLINSDYTCGLGFEILHNNKKILDIDHVQSVTPVTLTLDTVYGDHELKFVLKNKTSDHTTIDDAGQIVNDAYLTISNFSFNDVELNNIFLEKCQYHHDFNGSKDPVVLPFYNDLGCNGEVVFCFESPVYYWMLETIPYRKSKHV